MDAARSRACSRLTRSARAIGSTQDLADSRMRCRLEFAFIISHGQEFRPTATLLDAMSIWIEVQTRAGVRIDGRPLAPPGFGRTVRVRDGEVSAAIGPPTQADEQVCAYELYRCSSVEHAVDLAGQHPMAAVATIEVRPVWAGHVAG